MTQCPTVETFNLFMTYTRGFGRKGGESKDIRRKTKVTDIDGRIAKIEQHRAQCSQNRWPKGSRVAIVY